MRRSSKKAPESKKWFVLYCAEDESHSVVEETDVVCEPSVKVGETVSFFYGRKKPWDGVVKAIGCEYSLLQLRLYFQATLYRLLLA